MEDDPSMTGLFPKAPVRFQYALKKRQMVPDGSMGISIFLAQRGHQPTYAEPFLFL
jgi:hypothetical protein